MKTVIDCKTEIIIGGTLNFSIPWYRIKKWTYIPSAWSMYWSALKPSHPTTDVSLTSVLTFYSSKELNAFLQRTFWIAWADFIGTVNGSLTLKHIFRNWLMAVLLV